MTEKKSWTVILEEDPDTGDLMMPLPVDALSQLGWDFGDTLVWEDLKDGSWSLKKKQDDSGTDAV